MADRIMDVRIWLARIFLRIGWKLVGVRVSPGIVYINGREVRL